MALQRAARKAPSEADQFVNYPEPPYLGILFLDELPSYGAQAGHDPPDGHGRSVGMPPGGAASGLGSWD